MFKVANDVTAETVKQAILKGYRLIDTAAIYGNEAGVGQGIKEGLVEAGLTREDLFVTTKIWNTHLSYEESMQAFEESLSKLGLDYVDLYLIHWPGQSAFKESYQAMEELYRQGKVRAIGVSNFEIAHLQELAEFMTVPPVLNQVELHPKLTQEDIRAYCQDKGIAIQAWSPLMQGQILDNEVLQEIADKHGKHVAQVVFKWNLQNGILLLTKTENPDRMVTNAQLDDFELTPEEMQAIDALNEDRRVGPNPFEFSMKKEEN